MRNERGVALSVVVIVLFVLIGMVGLAVDVARIAYTAAEAQAAADAGAVAGAWALLKGAPNPVDSDVNAVLAGNRVNGETPSTSNSKALATIVPTADSVTVTVTTTVDNIVMPIYYLFRGVENPTSTVAKAATAAILNSGGGGPDLPVAIGDCKFTGDPVVLRQIPNTADNSAWTSFDSNVSGVPAVQQYLSWVSPSTGRCREAPEPVTPPFITTEDTIRINNGSTSLLKDIECMYCAGLIDFLVPVIPCGVQADGNEPRVVGFATIQVVSFCYGPPNGPCEDHVPCCGASDCTPFNFENSPKSINATVIPGVEPGGPGGGGAFGTRTVRLVG